ncbi:thiamine pyrophosphate-dependent dehydrogenase E1 component subunit alpha [Ruminiclostridium herbifermentans]|uniref:Thiamine pyrophosphate-dependent dehydrogenase E1 component subunit alpha n=1 Tax=Ruminiclostridium herbifermentans TaxID=2488810 RepID=A0A4U7JBJ5_9FIRM|nr:thiamine pyrophosphate-dependent dehydrogenase E1 component subunit alpha [Ruminiclostridium herbifermentans]QNU66893.1 thiamine pyrophosphate-dependent dehydrogenase E1 component subunit alpha [Ruminiclostridium herbifermentans]
MLDNDKLIELYKVMQTIRLVEHRIEDEYKYDEIKTPIHLSIGQEAISAGVCINLEKDDSVIGTHRSHAQYIAKGGDINKMIAELYLRKTGCSMGRGGSMHLIDPEAGVLGSTAIVGGSIPIGTGVALAAKLQNKNNVTAIFFGDGAVDEGTFHESLNFAAIKKLPAIYICENNSYAINSHEMVRHSTSIYRWAEGYGIPAYQIDGNDVLKVYDIAKKAISRARRGEGPSFIECITYRWKGHIGTVNDIGEGQRTQAEYDYWISKCPIKWFRDYLKGIGVLDDNMIKSIDEEINQIIKAAFEFAQNSPKPLPSDLLEFVYAD